MTIMPKVSVITPVYNGESYIDTAINSLLSQTLQDWELIVVDDGSTDSTPQILEKFKDQRIRIIRQQNAGEARARNVGLHNVTGEYVALLDADDFYFPTALEELSAFLDSHPQYDVVYSDGQICDEQDRFLMTLTEVRPGIYTGKILEKVVISSSVVTVPVCTMTRQSKILEHCVRFDPNLVIGPDWDFWIQLAVHVNFGYLNKITCKYRIHTANISRTTASEKRKKDQIYRRMKIMNAEWFDRLSSGTQELFFLDLLTNTLAGDSASQQQILQSARFAGIAVSKRADLWRMVGIDALKNGTDPVEVQSYLEESLKLKPADYKTRTLISTLRFSRPMTLMLVNLWHKFLQILKKGTSLGDSRSVRLQKLLGLQ
jgi:glycosyltransferase involved in cell wall biosynthesis